MLPANITWEGVPLPLAVKARTSILYMVKEDKL